jgi:hypothetical protein
MRVLAGPTDWSWGTRTRRPAREVRRRLRRGRRHGRSPRRRPITRRLPGDPRRIPNGCWSTAHLPTAISKLLADRSVNYLVAEVDDSSSRPFVADALSMVQHEPAGSHSTARTWLARSALDCRRWLPGLCKSCGMGTGSRPCATGMWGAGVGVMLVAGDGQR